MGLMEHLKRDSYLNQLIRFSKTQDIKVITGVRRSGDNGKSVLLEMFKEYLLKHEDNINIVSINLQELEYDCLLDYHFYINMRWNIMWKGNITF